MITNFETSVEITQLCDEILASNNHIFLVSSINRKGKSTECSYRNDRILQNMSKQEVEMYFMQRTLQTCLNMEFDNLIGPLNYIVIQRESFLELIFPYSQGIILLNCDLEIIPNLLGKKTLLMIRDFDLKRKNPMYA